MQEIFFLVAVIEKVLDDKITIEKFFKVFEFTKGKTYYELINEDDLAFYQNPLLIKGDNEFVLDTPDKAIKQLEGYRGQVNQKGKEILQKTMEEEIKRLSEKYNIKGDLSKID